MGKVRIVNVSKQLPAYSRDTKDIIPYVKLWLSGQDERYRRKVVKIFEGAGVDRRYGIMPIEDVFTATSFEAKNAIYSKIHKNWSFIKKKSLPTYPNFLDLCHPKHTLFFFFWPNSLLYIQMSWEKSV